MTKIDLKNNEKMKEGLGNRAYDLGFEYEKKYHGCAQCVVAAVQDTLNIRNDDIFKAMTGCGGGGGGYCNGSCGALVGGIVMLSWLAGRSRDEFQNVDVSRAYELTREPHNKFIGEYGAVICRDINMNAFGRPFYTADLDEYRKFQAAGSYVDKCTAVVGNASRWVVEIIIEEGLAPVPE